MQDPRAEDPAELLIAWEAVEELLAPVPEGTGKDVLRCLAAGLSVDEIADRFEIVPGEVAALAARARMRILTAAITPITP